MLLGFKIWPKSVVLNPLQFHKHFGIEICYLLLLNFDMTSVKTTNYCCRTTVHNNFKNTTHVLVFFIGLSKKFENLQWFYGE